MLTLAIVNELNLQGITIFEKEFKISQFADDTAIFLKDKGMVDIALKLIKAFSDASGLSLILRNVYCCLSTLVQKLYCLNNVQTEVKILGLTISKDVRRMEEVNIENRVVDMKKSLSHWLTRDLTVFWKSFLSKAEGV